jgi:hypothetical protein
MEIRMKEVFSANRRHATRGWPLMMVPALAVLGVSSASAADVASPVKDRTIGYVLANYFFAMYSTADGKSECPQGYNEGPIAQFEDLYPKDGPKRTVADTVLKREANIWFPSLEPEPFKFKDAVGTVATGLNLDGKVGPNDFTSPEGEPGIKNQLDRVLGCILDYRPGGSLRGFHNIYLRDRGYTRLLIEVTNVDSLVNDDNVTVTVYQGLDHLLTDASGNEILPNGTQRINARFDKTFYKQLHGKITNGVLTTEPADINIPIIMNYDVRAFFRIRDAQLKLNVTAEQANGLIGGYFDVEAFYKAINTAYASFHHNYGYQSEPSLYRALYRLADAHPDPKTGQNTAISGAIDIHFKQAFIAHPNQTPKVQQIAQGASAAWASR